MTVALEFLSGLTDQLFETQNATRSTQDSGAGANLPALKYSGREFLR